MRQCILVATIVLWLVTPLAAQTNEEENVHKRFAQCILLKGAGGHVWVGQPLVGLGMIGVRANPPVYRLSPTLAETFRPLVNELEQLHDQPEFWLWGLPKVQDASKPLLLVTVQCDAELRPPAANAGARDRAEHDSEAGAREYEITAVELLSVEIISATWRQAWDGLDSGLGEIVAASRTAPGVEKRQRLEKAIDESSRWLSVMTECRVDRQARDLVGRLAPKARVVRHMQLEIEREWGGQLREYVTRLQISPPTQLPAEKKLCPKLELLVASQSPAEFLTQIRRDWPEDTLDESLLYVPDLARVVAVWEVEDASAASFEAWRTQARQQLDRAQQEAQRSKPMAEPTSVEVPQWGVVLRPTDAQLLADKGLLHGAVVDSISADAPDVGLRTGDVIIDYSTVYDVRMAQYASFAPLERLKSMARYGGKLDVLRGDQIVTIEFH